MSKSLQEQLLRAGLANKKQAVKARKAQNTREKQARKGQVGEDETDSRIRHADAAKLARDRQLNQQRLEQDNARAIQAQITQLITLNRVEERGDIEYRYTHAELIKSIMTTEDQRQALVAGRLAIVAQGERTDLVPRAVARKILERDDITVLHCSNLTDNDAASDDADLDDEYAEFKVPDDLMW